MFVLAHAPPLSFLILIAFTVVVGLTLLFRALGFGFWGTIGSTVGVVAAIFLIAMLTLLV